MCDVMGILDDMTPLAKSFLNDFVQFERDLVLKTNNDILKANTAHECALGQLGTKDYIELAIAFSQSAGLKHKLRDAIYKDDDPFYMPLHPDTPESYEQLRSILPKLVQASREDRNMVRTLG